MSHSSIFNFKGDRTWLRPSSAFYWCLAALCIFRLAIPLVDIDEPIARNQVVEDAIQQGRGKPLHMAFFGSSRTLYGFPHDALCEFFDLPADNLVNFSIPSGTALDALDILSAIEPLPETLVTVVIDVAVWQFNQYLDKTAPIGKPAVLGSVPNSDSPPLARHISATGSIPSGPSSGNPLSITRSA